MTYDSILYRIKIDILSCIDHKNIIMFICHIKQQIYGKRPFLSGRAKL